jgi:signal transduction histidine kinase
MAMTETTKEPDIVHRLKNYICIISGFSELLINESSEADPRRDDLQEIYKAAQAAMAMMPDLADRLR